MIGVLFIPGHLDVWTSIDGCKLFIIQCSTYCTYNTLQLHDSNATDQSTKRVDRRPTNTGYKRIVRNKDHSTKYTLDTDLSEIRNKQRPWYT